MEKAPRRLCTTGYIFIGNPSANEDPREMWGSKGPTLKQRMMGWLGIEL
jgi:hypothetical protein